MQGVRLFRYFRLFRFSSSPWMGYNSAFHLNVTFRDRNMEEFSCACDKFERLEGAATIAYISQFLVRADEEEEEAGRTHYFCRRCGRPWVRVVEEGNRKASLIRLETDAEA